MKALFNKVSPTLTKSNKNTLKLNKYYSISLKNKFHNYNFTSFSSSNTIKSNNNIVTNSFSINKTCFSSFSSNSNLMYKTSKRNFCSKNPKDDKDDKDKNNSKKENEEDKKEKKDEDDKEQKKQEKKEDKEEKKSFSSYNREYRLYLTIPLLALFVWFKYLEYKIEDISFNKLLDLIKEGNVKVITIDNFNIYLSTCYVYHKNGQLVYKILVPDPAVFKDSLEKIKENVVNYH